MSVAYVVKRRRYVEARLAVDPKCHYCPTILTYETATIEHLVPRSRGGTWMQENLVLACAPCNVKKGNKPHDVMCSCPAGRIAEDALRRHAIRKRPVAAVLKTPLGSSE
jgi:hypothetical protein